MSPPRDPWTAGLPPAPPGWPRTLAPVPPSRFRLEDHYGPEFACLARLPVRERVREAEALAALYRLLANRGLRRHLGRTPHGA